jgi:methyltransferase (TIGR00027 family)
MRRAAHQVLDRPTVFEDPTAVRMAGGPGADFDERLRRSEQSPIAPFLRAFMAVRSRCAEDELARAMTRGVTQYVVLGAGLDTFCCRNPYPADKLRLFEVDHPATQMWKRERIDAAGLRPTGALTFVPVDFETQSLGAALEAAGYAACERALFSWLGVAPYLDAPTVKATLRFVAAAPAGSGVVFDYAVSPDGLNPVQRVVFDTLSSKVAAVGEPFRSFFDPQALAAELREIGFREIDDLDPDALNHRYFRGRADGLKVGGLARLLIAWV